MKVHSTKDPLLSHTKHPLHNESVIASAIGGGMRHFRVVSSGTKVRMVDVAVVWTPPLHNHQWKIRY